MRPEVSTPEPTPPEKESPAELLGAADIGLQARLLVGGLSNPQVVINKKTFLSIKDAGAQGIIEQVSKKYQKASLTQRRRYQEETGLTYARWRDGFNTYLHTIREDTEHSERKIFLETLGIADSVTADDFYNEYLSGKSDIVKFVGDVETSATREQIQQHEDIIRQLGNAFGYESSEVIDHLIHGVRNVKEDIDSFTNQARQQANTPDVINNPLLSRIEEDGEGLEQIPGVQPEVKEVPEKAEPVKATHPAKATPVTKVDLEEEPPKPEPPKPEPPKPEPPKPEPPKPEPPKPEPPKPEPPKPEPPKPEPPKPEPPAPEEKPATETVQVFPAPIQGEMQGVYSTADAIRLLSDADQIDHESEMTNKYTVTLLAMLEDYGDDFIIEKAESAVQRLQRTLQEIGLKRDKRSRSKSWYFQGIAKFRFLADNPDIQETVPDGREYEASDPLLHYRVGVHSYEGQQSHKSEEDIINGMLGWEVYRQRKRLSNILFHLDPLMASSEKRRLQELLAGSPQDTSGTLPTYKLRAIGRLIQSNISYK